jgi:hypothetical protein
VCLLKGLAGFHRINRDFVVRTALDLTDEPDVYETGYWVAPQYTGQDMPTEATNAAIRILTSQDALPELDVSWVETLRIGSNTAHRTYGRRPRRKIHLSVWSATRSFEAGGRYGSIPMRSLTAPRMRCLQPR